MSAVPQVLYIDDEKDLLDLAESFCAEEGVPVAVTDSASSALELFKLNQYPIIISDARMPEMSGHELLMKLKEEFNFQGYFILVTGDDGLIDKNHLQDYDLVLQKPLSFLKLTDDLKAMLSNPKK
jgi:CheY-like chemotaxis protein